MPGLAIVALALLAGSAAAERSQDGNLIVNLEGGFTPHKLPRHGRAPVAVNLEGWVKTADRSPLPRVNWIRLELAWKGQLYTRGLAVCPRARLRGTNTRQAIDTCGPARVGRGRLYAKIFVPNQPAFAVRAHITAFNGRTKAGRHAVLVHAYSSSPPVSFVIPFSVHHRAGAFRTVLVALIRRSAGPWPHVANFQIAVRRNFFADGKRHSYLTASCPAPRGFPGALFSFARATYTFEGGNQMTTTSVRGCQAR